METGDIHGLRAHLIEVVGHAFGPHPDERAQEIRTLKQRETHDILAALGVGPEDTVMDLGSGVGFGAAVTARRVKKLYCCDVRQSFLDLARAEVGDLPHVHFALKPRVGEFSFLEEGELDAVYSAGVFIHLNLFDIYLHFREFARVVRPGGRVLLNIASTEKLFTQTEATREFEEMAEAYRNNPDTFVGLMQWNSPPAVIRIAEHFGFRVLRENWVFLFERTEAPAPGRLDAPALGGSGISGGPFEEIGTNPLGHLLRARQRGRRRRGR